MGARSGIAQSGDGSKEITASSQALAVDVV